MDAALDAYQLTRTHRIGLVTADREHRAIADLVQVPGQTIL